MNTDRHTSGPWHIDRDGKHPYIVAGDTQPTWNRPVVCYLYRDVTPEDSVTIGAWLRSEENAEANARLIAAAPALLAALRDLIPLASEGVRFLDYGAVRPDEWESADKARAMLAAACATLTAVEGC